MTTRKTVDWSEPENRQKLFTLTDKELTKAFPNNTLEGLRRTRRKLRSEPVEVKKAVKAAIKKIPVVPMEVRKPRILIYDIETAPNLAYVWGKYEQDVIAYEWEWYMLCFAYKWLGEKKVHVIGLPDFKTWKKDTQDDSELVQKLHELFDEADVVIAHNGDQFDQKKSQARMVFHGLTPPAPYKQIDTKKVARKYFNFNSNKLDDLGKLLKCGQKLSTGGFGLWLGCMNGEKKAWDKMMRYNKQDVVLLEEVYLKLRPWIQNHPSMSVMSGIADACPKCGGGPLYVAKKRKTAKVGFAIQYQCQDCGGYSTPRRSEKTDIKFVN